MDRVVLVEQCGGLQQSEEGALLKWGGTMPPGLHLDLGLIYCSATGALPLSTCQVQLCQSLHRAVFTIWQGQEHESMLMISQ